MLTSDCSRSVSEFPWCNISSPQQRLSGQPDEAFGPDVRCADSPTVTMTISAETLRSLLRAHLSNKLLTDYQISFSIQKKPPKQPDRITEMRRYLNASQKPQAVGARGRLHGSLPLSALTGLQDVPTQLQFQRSTSAKSDQQVCGAEQRACLVIGCCPEGVSTANRCRRPSERKRSVNHPLSQDDGCFVLEEFWMNSV